MQVDFHMHSTYSDGVLRPQDLLAKAEMLGLYAIALTDHDEIAGSVSLIQQAHSSVKLLYGTELSASYMKKDIHILAYQYDPQSTSFLEYLAYYKEQRHKRIFSMVERCREHGYDISMEEIQADNPDAKAYGRPHIARLLVAKGYASDIKDVFNRILQPGGPCYLPKVKVSVGECVDVVHDAGGLAVMAHPSLTKNDDYVKTMLAENAFDGVEVYHSKHKPEDEARYAVMAADYKLLITGGSDFHGIPGRYPYELGQYTVEADRVRTFMEVVGLWK